MAFQLGAIEKFVFYVTVRHLYTEILFTPLYLCTEPHYIYRVYLFTFCYYAMPVFRHRISLKNFSIFLYFTNNKYFLSRKPLFTLRQVAKYFNNVYYFLFLFPFSFYVTFYETCVSYVMINLCKKIILYFCCSFLEIINSSD